MNNMADAPPIYIHNASCSATTKRPNAFTLHTSDGAVYHFACCDSLADKKDANQKANYGKMIEWVEKINFHANLEPCNQLKNYKEVRNKAREKRIYSNLHFRFPTTPPLISHHLVLRNSQEVEPSNIDPPPVPAMTAVITPSKIGDHPNLIELQM